VENIGIFLSVLASGFIAAGLVSAMHRTVSGETADFRLPLYNPLLAGWSLFLCLFAGPIIVITNAAKLWVKDAISDRLMVLCIAISFIWSFYSGIFVIQTLQFSGLIQTVLV